MADTSVSMDDPTNAKTATSKDKKCPFCQQSFTSSSLGRHLDLYIKEKNPKPADGIHHVEEIRKLRGQITRRQPRNSSGRAHSSHGREDSITSVTPAASASGRRSPESAVTIQYSRPGLRSANGSADGALTMASPHTEKYAPAETSSMDDRAQSIFEKTHWRATGVINDIPSFREESSQEIMRGAYGSVKAGKNAQTSRPADKQSIAKANFEHRQRLSDAQDEAKAAKLALREVLGALKAANMRVDQSASPFDYDPLTLDFPALALHCLEPPPTLHTLIPYASSESWSIAPPDQQQYEALRNHFLRSFKQWRITQSVSTKRKLDEFSYPPHSPMTDNEEEDPDYIVAANQTANELETKVDSHLNATFSQWQTLSASQRANYWSLELARSIGRKASTIKEFRTKTELLLQENENLREQVEQLSRCQQPKEFQMMPPSTVAVSAKAMMILGESGVTQGGVGLNLGDKDLPLGDLVQTSITRWKDVIRRTKAHTNGLSHQRELGTEHDSSALGVARSTAKVPTPFEFQKAATAAALHSRRQFDNHGAEGPDANMNDIHGEEDAEGELEDDIPSQDMQNSGGGVARESLYNYGVERGQREETQKSVQHDLRSPHTSEFLRNFEYQANTAGRRSTPGRHRAVDL